jgi:peptidoglycan/xylan/chitin deacetylase (PgdA/CDA1 family)
MTFHPSEGQTRSGKTGLSVQHLKTPGTFVISLDFELYWGLVNTFPLETIEHRIFGARRAVVAFLDLFEKYEIHATWAVVGFLFFESKQDLIAAVPAIRPFNGSGDVSPYDHLETIGPDERNDPYHFAHSLVERIQRIPFQELATHTFSHFIWNHKSPENDMAFRSDLRAAIHIARKRNSALTSIVFPQNEYYEQLLKIATEEGFSTFRGKRDRWYTFLESGGKTSRMIFRTLRMLDNHMNISGSHTFSWNSIARVKPYDIPGTWALECYAHLPWLAPFEPLRLRRIKKNLDRAAKNGELFHLWWHPHQFGIGLKRNLEYLENILDHFSKLRKSAQMISLNMNEISERIDQQSLKAKQRRKRTDEMQ